MNSLPDDHRVRLVWRFVEGLDLSALLGPIKSVEGRPGHPPADPRILLALWLYATIEGVASARHVARLCDEHIAYRWLCGGVGVNAKTLADFRVGHGAALDDLLVDSFAGLVTAGVASLDRVAQDGVRVRASAGASSFRRHSTLEECRAEATAALDRLRGEATRDPGAASRREAAARLRAAYDREHRVAKALTVTRELHNRQQERARRREERAFREKLKRADATRRARESEQQEPETNTKREGAARLDHGRRGAGDEDGRWRLPAGLQRAVRLRYAQRRGRRRRRRQQRLRHGQDGADERRRWRRTTADDRASIWPMAATPNSTTSRTWKTLASTSTRPCRRRATRTAIDTPRN